MELEELNKSLGIESDIDKSDKNDDVYKDEKVLNIVSYSVLIIGIIASIIMLISISFIEKKYGYEISISGISITLSTLLGSIMLWSLLKVISNISTTLKKIYKNMCN